MNEIMGTDAPESIKPIFGLGGYMKIPAVSIISFVLTGALLLIPAGEITATPASNTAAIAAAVDSRDRPVADRELDAARKPKDMLAFFGVAPNMKLLDLFTAGGWYSELEARVAGPHGEVYAQNPPQYVQMFGDKAISARLADSRLPTVKRWDKLLDAMELPKSYFDGAIANDVFHDFFWLSKDVNGIAKQIFEAIKPNGFLAVVDHSAPAGTGDAFARDLNGPHRIDEEFVKQILVKAGFVLEARSELLRNPEDDRTKAFFAPEMQGKNTDKFALLFRKPRS